MKIIVDFLPADQMRYDTAGDYFFADGNLFFQVRRTGNPFYDRLVLIHEIVELLLAEQAGITAGEIDEFDMAFTGDGEPGDDFNCPYKAQHSIATGIERTLAGVLGIDWAEYDKQVAGKCSERG